MISNELDYLLLLLARLLLNTRNTIGFIDE